MCTAVTQLFVKLKAGHDTSWLSKNLRPDMQFVTNFTRVQFQNIFLLKNMKIATSYVFQQNMLNFIFHIKNIHTQGYNTLNKYSLGIASIRLPKVSLWTTKCVTKRQLQGSYKAVKKM